MITIITWSAFGFVKAVLLAIIADMLLALKIWG